MKAAQLLRSQKGFSIVEIVAFLFLAVVITVLVMTLPNSFNLVGESRHESLAKEAVAEKIEDLRSESFDNLANGTSAFFDPRLSKIPENSAQVLVEDCPSDICQNSEEIKKITVSVTWNEGVSEKKVEVTTLIARGGLQ